MNLNRCFWSAANIPSGAKAQQIEVIQAARLKPCPFKADGTDAVRAVPFQNWLMKQLPGSLALADYLALAGGTIAFMRRYSTLWP